MTAGLPSDPEVAPMEAATETPNPNGPICLAVKDDVDQPAHFRNKKNPKRKQLSRLVSQDQLGMATEFESMNALSDAEQSRSTSPSRSVSEFDQAVPECSTKASAGLPPKTNPLVNRAMLKTHIAALRLEAQLHPMRLILSRLMLHPAHNRKGVFNQPVDPVALGLLDYHKIVTHPMDLATVKRRLHAVAYQSRPQVADDIRLVFHNSMRYNPPIHPIHKAAKELLISFEQSYQSLDISGSTSKSASIDAVPMEVESKVSVSQHLKGFSRLVSSVEGEAQPSLEEVPSSSPMSMDSTSSSMAEAPSAEALQPVAPPAVAADELPLNPIQGSTCQSVVPETQARATLSACSGHLGVSALLVIPPKKKSRLPPFLSHICGTCQGRNCKMCQQGCLQHEPALLVCQGVHCGGAKVRKGSVYFVSADGNHHYCHRCYINLTPVLPGTSEGEACRYKVDLLKRKNDEEIIEKWLNCSKCSGGVHAVCAMYDGYGHDDSTFLCIECLDHDESKVEGFSVPANDERYSFVSGSDNPVSMSYLGMTDVEGLSAESLPDCALSSFIQAKVAKVLHTILNADKTITVRVISDSSRHFSVPDVVRRHFRMATDSNQVVEPPSEVHYRQKAITLFQKIDGLDVCIFCMYVQEYDGKDDYETAFSVPIKARHDKRVYIAYIDSVEHFRPRECRTDVYHEILVSYLATARARGYEAAQIWACPPSRGNSFVFWNHPNSQRTPTRERLINWYHGALSRAIGCGVVTEIKSLFESEFEKYLSDLNENQKDGSTKPSGRMICPPLLDGDFWIEEAVRVHSACLSRYIKVRAPTEVCVWNVTPLSRDELDSYPVLQIAALVKDRVMTHPCSVPFRRPVNAAAMKLKNYHQIVTDPMDLGTIYSRCVIGEYKELCEIVDDVRLMVSNAKKFNPVGHFVYAKAHEVLELFFRELSALVEIWDASTAGTKESTWEDYKSISMSLDHTMDLPPPSTTSMKSTSVFIEDDRSSDGSRSIASSVVSMPSSPMSGVTLTKECDTAAEARPSIEAPTAKLVRTTGNGKGRSKSRRGLWKKKQVKGPPKKLDLLSDGPDAVMQSMIGQDSWLFDKRNSPAKTTGAKEGDGKRRRSDSTATASGLGDPAPKRRRQSWVGEEVSEAVRRFRTIFFTCSLVPKRSMLEAEQEKLVAFEAYADEFDRSMNSDVTLCSPISDARHSLLEFSQYRHFEFDTLRRAKHSTSMLLYHLVNSDAPGVVPMCSDCDVAIENIRWHKVKKTAEKRRVTKFLKPTQPVEPIFLQEELCGSCHANHSSKDEFIPIPVSLKLDS